MRVRDIIHRNGRRLRLSLARGESGESPLIRLSDPVRPVPAAIMLDLYAAEVLAGFLMSARVSAVGELSDERCNGEYPFALRLTAAGGGVHVELDQLGLRLLLPRMMWDRLYTELQLVLAHGRHLIEVTPPGGARQSEARRLLH